MVHARNARRRYWPARPGMGDINSEEPSSARSRPINGAFSQWMSNTGKMKTLATARTHHFTASREARLMSPHPLGLLRSAMGLVTDRADAPGCAAAQACGSRRRAAGADRAAVRLVEG